MIHDKKYDSIVIGAGHAGTEAALSIARTGYQVLFLTMNLDSICQMSCNPAIGGRTMMGIEYYGETIVVTTGTFMRGLIHVGDVNYPGGRGGDPPSLGLSESLKQHGFEVEIGRAHV